MSYNPNGGTSRISTSADVALNNTANNDLLSYDSNIGKWTNEAGSTYVAQDDTPCIISGLTPASTASDLATAQSNRSILDSVIAANPGRSFIIPAGTFALCAGANINASIRGMGEHLTFIQQWEAASSTQDFMFKQVGSFASATSVATNVAQKNSQVNLSSSVTLSQGSWVVLSSTEVLTVESGKTFYKGEALRVISPVNGATTVAFEQTINDSYAVASGAQITPMVTAQNFSMGHMTITNMQRGTTHVTGFFRCDIAERCYVEDVTLVGYNASAIQFRCSVDCAARRLTLMDGVNDTPGLGYGTEIQAACRNIRVSDFHIRGGRHAFTTNSTQTTGYPGQPIDVTLSGGTSNAPLSTAFDTHATGRDISIENCHASHCENAAFAIRSCSTQLLNCTADYAKIGLQIGLLSDTAYPSGVLIKNFYARHIQTTSTDATTTNGVGVVIDGNNNTNITIDGLHLDSIDRYGILFDGPVNQLKLRRAVFQDVMLNPATTNGTDVQAAIYIPASIGTMTAFDVDDAECINNPVSTTEPGIGGGQAANLLNVASSSVSGLLRNLKGQGLTGAVLVNASSSLVQSSLLASANNLSDVASPSSALGNLGAAPLTIAGSYMSGNYYHTASSGASSSSAGLGVNTLRLTPWFIPRTMTITRIGADVQIVGDSGSKVRLGIYADNGSGYPGSLVLDAGQIAGDSATVQEITISQNLNAGLYWVGAAVQTVSTTQPTLATFSDGATPVPLSLGNVIPTSALTAKGYLQTSVSSSLPGTFTSTVASTGNFPRIFVKIA